MSWGHILDDLAEENADPILASMDTLYDALLLLGSIVAAACFLLLVLITR